MKVLSAFLFFFLALTPSALIADPSSDTVTAWEFAGWYGGGCFPNLAFDSSTPGRVYLTSDVAGVWRSDDNGERWNIKTAGLGQMNVPAVSVSASGAVLAATKGGLFRSDDAGEHWRVCGGPAKDFVFQRPESYRPVWVSADGRQIVAGTADGRIYQSGDGCESWQALGEKPVFEKGAVTAVQRTGQGLLLASGTAGLMRHRAEGNAWEAVPDSPREISDFKITREDSEGARLAVASLGNLYEYSDRLGWKKQLVSEKGVYRVEPSPDGRLWIAANVSWHGTVLARQADGIRWQKEGGMKGDAGLDPTRAWAGVHERVASLAVSPHDPNILFRTDWWAVWRSDDGGNTWTEKIRGAANTVVSDVWAAGGRVLAATMDNGLLISSNAGRTYRAAFPEFGYRADIQGHIWRARLDGNRVLATSSPWNANFNQTIRSDDGGRTFQIIRHGLSTHRPSRNTVWNYGYPRGLAVFSADPNKVYLGMDGDDGGGLFLSHDGGLSWAESPTRPPSRRIYRALAVDLQDPERIYWGANDNETGGIYVTEDGGKNWRLAFDQIRQVLVLIVDPKGRIYAGGEGGKTCVSEDQGRSWRMLPELPDQGSVVALCPIAGAPDRLIAGTMQWNEKAGGGVWITDLGGSSWKSLSEDLPGGVGVSTIAYDEAQDRLYAGRHGSGIYKRKLGSERKG